MNRLSRDLLRVGLGACLAALAVSPSLAQDDPTAKQEARKPSNPDALLDGVPQAFTPLQPRSVVDRETLEVLRLYAGARALEDQRLGREALELLEKIQKLKPDDPAILRRLTRRCAAVGQIDRALEFGRKALDVDPNDSSTLAFVVALLIERKSDAGAAETLLRHVLAHQALDKHGPASLVAGRFLGDLYYEVLNKPEKAAEAYADVLNGLDDRAAMRLSQRDQRLIFRTSEAESYRRFGEALMRSKEYDLALRSLRHGLAHEPDDVQIPRLLAETQLRMGKSDEALATLEAYLKRQPQGTEPYDLLAEILAALNRSQELLPRLEQAAKADPKNVSLQLALAEHYRRAGRVDESESLLRDLLRGQRDPRVYGALVSALVKQRKASELLQVLAQAIGQRGGLQSVLPSIAEVAADAQLSTELLSEGLRLQQAQPPALSDPARAVLLVLGRQIRQFEPLVSIDRLAFKANENPTNFRELITDLFNNKQFAEAVSTIEEFLGKQPQQRDLNNLLILAQCQFLSGQVDAALDSMREAERLDPNSPETRFRLASLYTQLGRHDEAIARFQRLIQDFPNEERIERVARLGLSTVYMDRNDNAKAEAELEILLGNDPDDGGVNNDLGYLYADQGKHLEKAEAMIRKAIDQEPENGAFLDSLGWVLYKRKKPSDAVAPLEKAAHKPEASPTNFDHLGDVYFELGRYDDARKAWTRAEELAAEAKPPDRRLASIRGKLAELKALTSSGLPARPSDP